MGVPDGGDFGGAHAYRQERGPLLPDGRVQLEQAGCRRHIRHPGRVFNRCAAGEHVDDLAATYDRTTLRLFVNGVQVASGAQTAPVSTSTSATLTIGGNAYGEYFTGLIDEVRVYNRALTAGEYRVLHGNAPGRRLQ